MKKMWIVLSLVIVSMFIVGCGTGQAVKVGKVAKEAPALKESAKVLEFVDREELEKFYSPAAVWELPSKNGIQICKEMGYSGCEAGSFFNHHVVYKSNDTSCKGGFEYENDDTKLMSCNYWSSPPASEICQNSGGQDYGTSRYITGVFCVK